MAKSYKREIGVALLIWLVYIVETKSEAVIEILVWPIFTYVAAAFGFHSYTTQLQQNISSRSSDRFRPERSSEHTDWEREQTGSSRPDSPD